MDENGHKASLALANSVFSYTTDTFPNSFSLKDNSNIEPLNIGFANLKKISEIKLAQPPSMLT